MNVSISQVKKWREEVGATHLIVFAVDKDGEQCVATHGETRQHAKEAAEAGNKLKRSLEWPEKLCYDEPLTRICKNCVYYRTDFGTHSMNCTHSCYKYGWTDDVSSGYCMLTHPRVKVASDETCKDFEPL